MWHIMFGSWSMVVGVFFEETLTWVASAVPNFNSLSRLHDSCHCHIITTRFYHVLLEYTIADFVSFAYLRKYCQPPH